MGEIVWFASYPKSGNTWLRALMTNYLSDADEPADINRLLGAPGSAARAWFDEWCGVEAAALPPDVVTRLRPDVYRRMARSSPGTLFMKAHDAWTLTDRGEPLFSPDASVTAVYVVRNPLDVAVSLAHHTGRSPDRAVDDLCSEETTLARSDGRLRDQLPQRIGSWGGHARGWLDQRALPVHLVHYEDLRTDPARVFAGVARACGLPLDTARLEKAVRFSDLGELRRQEEAKGFRERLGIASTAFFRRGRPGGWRDELAPELAARITASQGPMMRRLGYPDVADEMSGS